MAQVPMNFRRVVLAAAAGNVIEWYDFYIFGSLAAILSVKFFDKSNPVAALLSTIALFTAGFLIRPLGAFLFGWLGDKVGRKYTFIVTLTGMGLGTAAIGLIPTYASIGVAAAFILFGLRMLQGLCLGGEYGGAITYVAEHVSDERRGYYTGWLQTSPTLGIVVSLLVIISTRSYLGEEAFKAWGWRIPFLISFLLVMMAIYIRLQLGETPIFHEMKAKGGMVKNPWKEAFLSRNIKFILVAIVVLLGQGVVWYSGQFWALYFLQTVKKLDVLTSSTIVGIALLIASPTLIFFGWLSDLIGRKPVILGGMLLAALTYYPLYMWLGGVTNPGAVNYPTAIFIIFILVAYVGMVYGPVGAFLAEYFPSRIRYTSVSVPYHIGNGWGGGLVPFITSAAYLSTGSVGRALIYPIAVPAVCFIICMFVMPETRHNRIWGTDKPHPQPVGSLM
ncbi:MAG TPA: MFS transporter [Steroidobacteraceae bacterium]|nr:MFS transporter [Steroidobacteraceae bacterium]